MTFAANRDRTDRPPPLEPPLPALTDGVIRLRPFSLTDVDQIYEACQDPRLQQYIPVPRPYHRHDAEAYVERTHRQWQSGEKAAFAINEAGHPEVLVGAANLAISGPCGNAAYWIVPGARGLGIATRALQLVTAWGIGTLGLGVILLEIHHSNAASIHVAEGAGYHAVGQLQVNTVTGERNHLIFSHLASGSDGHHVDR